VTFAVTGGSFRPRAKFFAAFRRDAETTHRRYAETLLVIRKVQYTQ